MGARYGTGSFVGFSLFYCFLVRFRFPQCKQRIKWKLCGDITCDVPWMPPVRQGPDKILSIQPANPDIRRSRVKVIW